MKARIIVVFRNDDPAADMDLAHERDIFGLFERFNVPQTLGVVPRITKGRLRDPAATGETPLQAGSEAATFLSEYARRSRSEVALHGFTHRANRYSIPSRREFSEFRGLSLAEQEQMIRAGIEGLEQALGIRPVTFIPPWNRMDSNTVTACARAGCRIISAGPFVPTTNGLFAFGANTSLTGFQSALAEARAGRGVVFLHVLFHSRTLDDAQRQLLVQALETVANDPAIEAMTICEVVARFPAEVRKFNEAGVALEPYLDFPGRARARLSIYSARDSALRWLGTLPQLESEARSRYGQGDYDACVALGQRIDRVSNRLLWRARLAIGLGAGLAGWGLAEVLSLLLGATGLLWSALLPLLVLVAATVARSRATAPDTRRELWVAGGWAAVGSALGAMLAG